MNKRIRKKILRRNNKKLIKEYPFLLPIYNEYGFPENNYKYDYTILDDLPVGWRKAFGILMLDELKEELIKHNILHKYRVLQVKEKYGGLRWYVSGYPHESKVNEIIKKYEIISENVCIKCGKPDVPMVNAGWISPYCKKCWWNKELYDGFTKNSRTSIKEEYKFSFYKDGKWNDETIDIKETVEKIRYNYNKRRRKNA